MSLALSLIAPVPIPPHLLADSQVIAAAIIFAVSYLVFALGKLPGMKIDRPGMAIIGAVLMVAFGIVRADQALRFIDFGTLVLLFSMMVSSAVCASPASSTGSPATSVMPPQAAPSAAHGHLHHRRAVGILRQRHHLPGHGSLRAGDHAAHGTQAASYLLAVATASNIGSVATITGNPQNMLIG